MDTRTISPPVQTLARKAREVPTLVRAENLKTTLKSRKQRLVDQKTLEKQVIEVGELERQRIGRDLHDSLGGQLTGIALLAKALMQKLACKGVAEASMAEEVVGGIGQAIARTRAIAHRLCPVEAGAKGLVGCLRKLADEVCRWGGTDCRFSGEEDVYVQDDSVASHLFRIAEEAVQNALRHGHPKRIEIRLYNTRTGILLQVWNDGEPLPAKAKAVRGSGFSSMRYRAAMIGASLNIRPAPRGGTEVCCGLLGFKQEGRKQTCKS